MDLTAWPPVATGGLLRCQVRYIVPVDELEAVGLAAYDREMAEHELDKCRERLRHAVVTALRAGKRPTDVAERSGWTASYVRRIARSEGIPAR